VIVRGGPCRRIRLLITVLAVVSALISTISLKITPFVSLSVITRIFVRPSLLDKSVMKSIKTSYYRRSRTSKGFNSPFFYSLQAFIRL